MRRGLQPEVLNVVNVLEKVVRLLKWRRKGERYVISISHLKQ